MLEFLKEYALFLAETATITVAFLTVFGGIIAMILKGKGEKNDPIRVKCVNEKYKDFARLLQREVLSEKELKLLKKQEKLERKREKKAKANESEKRKRTFILNFDGDTQASAVDSFREEITAILTIATKEDEVLLCLESGGGAVHAYGLAASQLLRIRNRGIPLTVAVDKIAASGGYMMASVANKILAAPFAIIGSIGVVAQLPNFNRLLKEKQIDFEQITAGEYKRTLTLFGENTDEDRKKVQEDVEEAHTLFKQFINEYRQDVDLEKVATGEHWYGSQALELKLIDQMITSDDYLLESSENRDLYEINYEIKQKLTEKIPLAIQNSFYQLMTRWFKPE